MKPSDNGAVVERLEPAEPNPGHTPAFRSLILLAWILSLLLLPIHVRADSTVVFNEILYHPATNEAALEWIELYNQMAVDMDLSGWSIQGGIQFQFPEGAILTGGNYLVIAAVPSALVAASGLTNVYGPFAGRLANQGETLKLRNHSGRLMDSVRYEDQGDWPAAADGAGVSLAKIGPNTASEPPANWTFSAQIGGTPGRINFTSGVPTGKTTLLVPFNANWKYDDSGLDRGTAWREAAYDAQSWAAGPGLFYVGGASLPIPKGTALTPGRKAYYFRTTFDYAGGTPAILFNLNSVLDDGAVFYLNGAEVFRFNLPAGVIAYSTPALASLSEAQSIGPMALPVNRLKVGQNVFAAEVHQGPAWSATSGLSFAPAPGYTLTWDGNDGDYFDSRPGAGVPDNLALASRGTVAFGSSQYGGGGIHLIINVNDRLYGNSHSWLANFPAGDPNPYIGLRFNAPVQIASLAWGRDNTGQYSDRWQGNYTLQITRASNPGANTAETGNALTGWATLGTVALNSAESGFRPWVRHRFNVAAASGSITATGLRIKVSDPNIAIDELEVYSEPSSGNDDIAFGAELSSTEILSGNPHIAFNEVAAAHSSSFWLELVNRDAPAISLENFVLVCAGEVGGTYLLPAQTLASDDYLVLAEAQLGFRPRAGDKLFLFPPDRHSVLDAVVVRNTLRGRLPQGTGSWLYPDQPTPGATNHFALHDEVVINEIMYHPRPLSATPAVVLSTNLLSIDSAWKYNQSGTDLGAAWREPGYDDRSWPSGRALLYVESALLPAPTHTPLTLGPTTYYFRTPFRFDGSLTHASLFLNSVVDDGAVFYLNGQEFYRLNMPDGALTASTLSSSGVGDAAYSGLIAVPTRYLVSGANILAVEVHQSATNSSDIVFGAALTTTMELKPAEPFRESPESWVELYNRSPHAVDLTGWELAGGIEYRFPAGTLLGPDQYVVVAQDAAFLRTRYPGIDILGDFTRRLSHRSDRIALRDERGNPVNELRYYDGGTWPAYADGGGSSLELRDPRADNSKAEAWAASDESAKSVWRTYTYRGTANAEYPTERWNEFVLGLLGPGEVLLDDLSVVESPAGAAVQKLQNGSFANGATAWRFAGNHLLSRVITDPINPANKVLYLMASGGTEDRGNHIETTFLNNLAVVNGREYEISFRAKWLAGDNFLSTRLYFNRLARRHELEAPRFNGTPGAPNSRYETNIGPTYSELRHSPVAPAAGEGVTVSVAAQDPDGVAAATLWWSVNSGAWTSGAMDPAEDGRFTGQIPGQAAGSVAQFYLEGRDARGARSAFPARGRDSRALFKVPDAPPASDPKHILQILTTPADTTRLHALTNAMSNHDVGCTIVYDGQEVYYDVGVRLDGSPAARPSTTYLGFALTFHPDPLFRGVHETVTLDRSGRGALVSNGQEEILIKHMINRAGGLPGMYDDLVYVLAPRRSENGPALMILAGYERIFLDSQYAQGGDGMLFNYDLIYQMNATAGEAVQGPKIPLNYTHPAYNVDLENLGDDKETYRWYYRLLNGRERDDYSGLIQFLKAMSLTGSALDTATRQTMDVDEWLRAFAMTSLAGVGGDTYGRGLNHNLKLYIRPADQKVLAFPWDMDNSAFGLPTGAPLWGGGNLSKVILLPGHQRLYYGHLLDLITTTFNTRYMSYWTAHYSRLLPGQNFNSALGYITARTTYVMGQLPRRVPFALTTHGGRDFMVTTPSVALNGTAWIDTKQLMLQGNSNGLNFTWTASTNWQTTVPLILGVNPLSFVAVDFHGMPIATQSVTVTSTALSGGLDSDQDGMPDLWELAQSLDPNSPADATLDLDNDGLTNLQEYLSGTDPREGRSALRIAVTRSVEGGVKLAFGAMAGRSYSVLYSEPSAPGQWMKLTNAAAQATDHTVEWIDPQAGGPPGRFYRLLTPQLP